jgi:hypothetical protein
LEIFKFRPSSRTQLTCADEREDGQPQCDTGSRVSIVGFKGAQEIRQLVARHRLVTALPTRRAECTPQIGRGVMLRLSGHNGIAKYLPAGLA